MVHVGINDDCVILDFEDILATVSFFMDRKVDCKLWATYQERRYVAEDSNGF